MEISILQEKSDQKVKRKPWQLARSLIDPNAPHFINIGEGKELRCPQCNKLLGKGEPGQIEIKCARCGLLCRFRQL